MVLWLLFAGIARNALAFDVNSTLEGESLAAQFSILNSSLPIHPCNRYDNDFFGPAISYYTRKTHFSRSLQMRPCKLPARVSASVDGYVFDKKADIITLRHEFSNQAPLPRFHGVEVQYFYTTYANIAANVNITEGMNVSRGDLLGYIVKSSLEGDPFRFELRVGAPYSLEYQSRNPTAFNVGYDPAVNWNWLLKLVDEPTPAPKLELISPVTGILAGRLVYSTDASAAWLNKVTFEALGAHNETVLASAELDLNFRIGYFTDLGLDDHPDINIFDEATMYLDPVASWDMGEDTTYASVVYRTEIVLPPTLHAGGTYFRVNVTDIWGNMISERWGMPYSSRCPLWYQDAQTEAANPAKPTLAEYFSRFEATWPVDPEVGNYEGLTTHFGPRRLCLNRATSQQYDFNKGYNIRTPSGSRVAALAGGVVHLVGGTEMDDLFVLIKHEFCAPQPYFHGQKVSIYYTKYSHLSEIVVSVGDDVEQGQLIAYSGFFTSPCCVGSSLRIELRVGSNCDLPYALSPKSLTDGANCLNRANKWDPHVNPWFVLPKPEDTSSCAGADVVCDSTLRWLSAPSATGTTPAIARYSVSASCPLLNRIDLYKQYTSTVTECEMYTPPLLGLVVPNAFSGSRSATVSGEIVHFESGGKWAQFSLSFQISVNPDDSYHYRYTLSGLNKKALHSFVLEVGSPFPSSQMRNENRRAAISSWALGSVGGVEHTLLGIKFVDFLSSGKSKSEVEQVIEFDSDRKPVWGNFFAKGGSETTILFEDDTKDGSDDSKLYVHSAKLAQHPTVSTTDFSGWIPTPGPQDPAPVPLENCEDVPGTLVNELVERLDFNDRTGYLPETNALLDEPRRDHLHIEPAFQLYSDDGTWWIDIVIPAAYMSNSAEAFSLRTYNTWGAEESRLEDPRDVNIIVAQAQMLNENLQTANTQANQANAKAESAHNGKVAAIVVAAMIVVVSIVIVGYQQYKIMTLDKADPAVHGSTPSTRGRGISKQIHPMGGSPNTAYKTLRGPRPIQEGSMETNTNGQPIQETNTNGQPIQEGSMETNTNGAASS